MYKDKKIIAVITARAGSKGLPGKNIKPMLGKPLIAWTIEQGQASQYIDRMIVSTDGEDIARVSKKYGAEVPFMRPDHLASDTSSSIDAIVHALDFVESEGEQYDYVVILEPTSPLRETSDIDTAIEMLIDHPGGAVSIMGVCKVEGAHPMFTSTINEKNILIPYDRESFAHARRQDISDVYFFEGTIYISDIAELRKRKALCHDKTMPYIVPRWKAIEVDELMDFVSVEAILKNIQEIKGGVPSHV